METREIKTIKIGDHTLEVKSYLIGREKRALSAVFLGKNMTVSVEGGMTGLDADTFEKAQDLAFKSVLVSFDGHKDGDTIEGVDKPFSIVDAVLDLPAKQYEEVVETVNAITSDKDFLVG